MFKEEGLITLSRCQQDLIDDALLLRIYSYFLSILLSITFSETDTAAYVEERCQYLNNKLLSLLTMLPTIRAELQTSIYYFFWPHTF